MQAVVKAPRINVSITGRGVKAFVQEIQRHIKGVTVNFIPEKKQVDNWLAEPVTAQDEVDSVNPFTTEWFKGGMAKMTPGDRLDAERYKKGLSQVELAKTTGLRQHHISEMESGKRPIGKLAAKKIGAALKTDYRVFL